MIALDDFCRALDEVGLDFLTGVPCSSFSGVIARYSGRSYHAAPGEGEAVAMACGAWLGGRFPLVCLQNSGLGNALNPLVSLVQTFGIPMVLLVSHRGRGPDAPQHRLMGAITPALLESMEIPILELGDETGAALEQMRRAAKLARSRMGPTALLMAKGALEKGASREAPPPPAPRPGAAVEAETPAPGQRPTRTAALQGLLAGLRETDLVVSTTGMTSRELWALQDRPGNFYMVGSMGCAAAIGLGLALALPRRRVVVVDGDGALVMRMGILPAIGHHGPRNLAHVVLDNGTYATTGDQPTPASACRFARMAAAAGYGRCVELSGPEGLAALLGHRPEASGPVFAQLAIRPGNDEGTPRVAQKPEELRDRFRDFALEPAPLP